MQTLVVYDIHDDSRRLRLSRLLQRYGLTRVQYSAFRGDTNPHDRMVLAKKMAPFVKDDNDSVFLIPLCERCIGTVEVLGASKKGFSPGPTVKIV
ncbi:MAG: CRISPR-associated endonuclease Cas2 [Methanomicrobiales archaeon]|nr:CRISPR-associated endonuclease Cas2 [Methanomicrobiales archaeon]MDI6876081.1 CRISPR-associated endonuclease Cas2 [Methanomicrobiales archaeon]